MEAIKNRLAALLFMLLIPLAALAMGLVDDEWLSWDEWKEAYSDLFTLLIKGEL